MDEKREAHAMGQSVVTGVCSRNLVEPAEGPALTELHVSEAFTGEIEGEGIAHVIQATRKDGSATFAGIERVRGSIGDREGTFLLEVSGTIVGTEMHAEWFVVPGSGSGALFGLAGEGGFDAERGRHGSVWLDY